MLTDSSPVDFPDLGIAPSTSPFDDLEITQTDPLKVPTLKQYEIKVVYQSTDANEVAAASAEAKFTVTMVDACYYNTITCDPL